MFLGEHPEHLELKKLQLGAEKCPISFAFFPVVQSDELRGGPSVAVTTISGDNNHGGQTSGGCCWIPGGI